MSDLNEKARHLLPQEPGREMRLGKPTGNLAVAQHKGKRHCGGTPCRFAFINGGPFRIIVTGRVRWELDLLCSRGATGLTSFDTLARRLSAYVHSRRELGVEIDTLNGQNEGDYQGNHGRCVPRPGAQVDWKGGAA